MGGRQRQTTSKGGLAVGAIAQPLDGLDEAALARFQVGAREFSEVDSASQGLGPLFNAGSCEQCRNSPFPGGGQRRCALVGPRARRAGAGALERFMAWKNKIVINPKILGGEPVFPKSRLSVRQIGALVMNDGLDEIREDYPYLSEQHIEFARLYTLAYPKRGRPRA